MSTCPHVSSIDYQVVSRKLSDPSTWTCDQCSSNTESVWVCLQCAHIGCGRTCRQKHAKKHFDASCHPVVLHINQKMLFCYQCEDWILNDTQFGEIGLLREQLNRLQNQRFECSQTRSGSVIRGPLKQFKFVERKDDRVGHERTGFSGEFTAKRFYTLSLLKKCIAAWKTFVAEQAGELSQRTKQSPGEGKPSPARRFVGRTGLRNIGNTCYQNATLMCLSALGAIRQLLSLQPDPPPPGQGLAKRPRLGRRISEELYEEANSRRDPSKIGSSTVLAQLHRLFRVLWSGKWAGVSPAFFVKSFMMAVPSFQGYVQHDAHEFLTELLDVVQRDIAYPVEVRTILSRVFTSVQQSATRCHVCNNVSKYTFPDATCITLDLSATVERLQQTNAESSGDRRYPRRRSSLYATQNQACTLMDCLDALIAPVELTNGSQYRCVSASCKGQLVNATKQDSFERLGQCVVFHINRTKWDSQGKRKIMNKVEFPLRNLDLSVLLSDRSIPRRYHLRGIVLHHGPDIDQGHYTSVCFIDSLSTFVAYNDLSSETVIEQDLVEERYDGNPYLLFYEISS
ncbi:hypothetical protein PBRA_000241 [Plasmodiophora brassicae]|uniref:Uncharacterized protein n=1 Tax=Plasmodiophora brassicae TaxID=37360 RepID=A0A0G4IGV9_PLABS|nr:hypothetical protein PBRA_000241 [Plasmodiophora brassicae]